MRSVCPIYVLNLALTLALAGCVNPDEELFAGSDGGVPDFGIPGDADTICSDPTGDYDSDGISNAMEGCLTGRDSDGDKTPDWQDFDSDGDKLPDTMESGTKDASGKCAGAKAPKDKWPCDTDGDGVPDYLDKDSDGDGLEDGDEDYNGDGEFGCCLAKCNTPVSAWQKQNCKLVTSSPAKSTDGCGKGQVCANGLCTPSVGLKCSEGETSPKKKDSLGDGRLDDERGGYICRDATEDRPGRKAVQLRRHQGGDWHIAIEKFAKYGEIKIAGATSKMAAASINYDKSTDEVAGFVVSKGTLNSAIQTDHTALLSALTSAGLGTVTVRASGTQGKSHDKYDMIEGAVIDLAPSGGMDVSSARDRVVAALLGKQVSDLSNLSAPFGSSHTSLVLRLTTVRRFEFKRDANKKTVKDSTGYPVDDGNSSKWRIIVMGALASKINYQNPKVQTGFLLEDLANGTSVAIYQDAVENECDADVIQQLPVADIVWVIDESGSMSTERQDVVNNANNFFSRALASGLDFRMGVTNVCTPNGSYKKCLGKFCSVASTDQYHDGGADRFLLPTEQATFSACIKNPPCYEGGSEYSLVNARDAVKRHLPRATNDPYKIRTGATLVLIVVTDEVANSLSGVGFSSKACPLDATTQTKLDQALQPYMNLFTGVTDPEAVSMYHIIGNVCGGASTSQMNHGHMTLANKLGGQTASVAQKNLGNTLQLIIESIIGKASPVKLDYVPISSSLAVVMDAVEIKRSRTNGFDYRTNGNSLVFINVKYKKGSEVIASYKRWKRQEIEG